MPRITDRRTENEVFKNYRPGMKFAYLERILKKQNIFVSDKTCKKIVEMKGKRREATVRGEEFKQYRRSNKVSPKVLKLVDRKTSVKNPTPQRTIAIQAGISQSKVHEVIYNDLNKEKREREKKKTTNVLNSKDKKNRKSNCWKLYRDHLSGEKCKFVVTLDESWIRLKVDGGTTSLLCEERRESTERLDQAESFTLGAKIYGRCCNVLQTYFLSDSSANWN